MVKSPLALGTKGSFLQLSRRDKDPSLVPRNANSEEEGDDDTATPPEPTPSFITQAQCQPVVACHQKRLLCTIYPALSMLRFTAKPPDGCRSASGYDAQRHRRG